MATNCLIEIYTIFNSRKEQQAGDKLLSAASGQTVQQMIDAAVSEAGVGESASVLSRGM